MNSLLLCCGLALAAPAAASATPAADASADTYVLCGNRACALVDRDGHLVTPRLFEQVEPLEHGLAVFGKDEHHGVVDRAGHTVVPPVYDVLHLLADGRIWASRKDAKGNDEPVGDLFDATGHLLGRGEDPPDPPDSPPADGPAVEILRTADGQALGDGHGRRISEAFDRIFPPYDDAQSMLAVRERDGRKSMGQLFLDGRLLPFPPDAQIDEFHEGLAVLRRDFPPAETGGRPRMRMGLVDAQGRVVLPATFDEVRPVHDGLAAVRLGKLWGIADRSGRLRVPPTYPWMDFKAHDGRFAVRIADGGKAGVIDGDGRWIVPAGYKSVQWVDDGLVAATNASIDAQGREDSTTLLFTRDGERLPAPPMHYPPYAMRALPLLRFHGLDDREGLMDRRGAVVAYDVQDNEPDTVRGPYFVRRGNDWAVVAAYGGELSPRRFGDIKQPYRHGRAVADEQLLDEHGRVLASFASVAPQAAADDDLDPEAAERVDPCYSLADLTADPADPPSAAIPAGLRPVCADPGLRASLRDARWRYAVRLADVDDPLPFVLEQAAF
ncbi:MAG TPA: WG repeat-containing protein, partial [Burkholderiaceae bacterium]